MNYDAFFEPISFFLTGMEKHSYYKRDDLMNNSKNFERDLREKMAKLPYNSLLAAMNQLDNHDHSRFITRTSGFVDSQRSNSDVSNPQKANENLNLGIMKEAVVLQMTLPGAPTLYYGNEAGVSGFTDPDSRRTYPWGNENKELLKFYKDIIDIHKKYSCFKTGSTESLYFKTDGVYSFGRWDNSFRSVVIVNNNSEDKSIKVPVYTLGGIDGDKFISVLTSYRDGHNLTKRKHIVVNGVLDIIVPQYGSIVLVSKVTSSLRDIDDSTQEKRPQIVATSFQKNETINRDNSIVFEFDHLMVQRDILEVFQVEPNIEGIFSWNGKRVSFKPINGWLPNRTYSIKIGKEIRAVTGELELSEDFTTNLTVGG